YEMALDKQPFSLTFFDASNTTKEVRAFECCLCLISQKTVGLGDDTRETSQDISSKERYPMAFELPPLPYDYNALEPYIDTQTMQLHHDKHHQTYVTNLNNALQSAQAIPGPHAEPTIPGPHAEPTIPGPHAMQFASMSVDDVVRHIHDVPDSIRTAVRNNAGGHS